MKYEKAIIINDTHIPFSDTKAVELFFKFIKDFKPDKVFLAGDIVDCFELSRFIQPPELGKHIRDELAETRIFLTRLRHQCPKSEIIYIEGNHERRFNKFILERAEELWGLEGLSLKAQLNLKELDIKYIPSIGEEAWYKYGALYIGHFNKISKHSAFTAKAIIDDKGVSIVQGHCHRMGSTYKTLLGGQIAGYENGCMCNLEPFYTNTPNWQLGFSIVYKKVNDDRFHLYQLPIINYKFFWGKEYSL